MASLVTADNHTTTMTTTTRRRTTTRRTTSTATETSEEINNSTLSHFEDLPGILQICIGTATKPGLIAYFDDDILAMINMFAKTCKKFLEYDPLRFYYFRVVLTKKYGVNFDDSSVTLDGKNIRDEDLQNISEALKANNTLTYLSLSNNYIIDVQSIGELLKTNNTLKVLYLVNNNITDVQSIGEGLKSNNTLKVLWLNNNNITDVQSIGEGLKTNNTLKILSLSNNNITDDSGIQSIIDVLKTNNTLKYLHLGDNQLNDNMKSQLRAIKQYKRDGSNGYQQVEGMWIFTE